MAGATGAVMLARDTHPAALLLLSAAVVAAGLVGLAIHRALGGFLDVPDGLQTPLPDNARENLEKEKLLAMRAIKELEFDRAMRKVSERDYEDMLGRLRRRAMTIMQELEHHAEPPPAQPVAPPAGVCRDCGTANDADARFCKRCGAAMARGATP